MEANRANFQAEVKGGEVKAPPKWAASPAGPANPPTPYTLEQFQQIVVAKVWAARKSEPMKERQQQRFQTRKGSSESH